MPLKIRHHLKSHVDYFYFLMLLLLLVGLPFGIQAYDRSLKPHGLPPGAKPFSLIASAQKGWLLGDFQTYRPLSFRNESGIRTAPVIEVMLGDLVVLKIRSSDVTHGFSLKAFGIYMANGIKPGKTAYVTFRADKVGTFIFTCNVFCGDIHQHMKGKLVVK